MAVLAFPQIHPRSLEQLVVSIINMRNAEGQQVRLKLKDCLSEQLYLQFPEEFRQFDEDPEGFVKREQQKVKLILPT